MKSKAQLACLGFILLGVYEITWMFNFGGQLSVFLTALCACCAYLAYAVGKGNEES